MTDPVPQHWRIELGRHPRAWKVFLNDELWHTVQWFQVEAGFDPSGTIIVPTLTLRLLPQTIVVDIPSERQGDMTDGLFGEYRQP
jgi:hypothetical protein